MEEVMRAKKSKYLEIAVALVFALIICIPEASFADELVVKNGLLWADENKRKIEEIRIPSELQYENGDYGFSVILPVDWEGYTIIVSEWAGDRRDVNNGGGGTETGPLIYIRHPSWTEEDPYQDIPVMVFTYKQWEEVQSESEELTIGAAPVPPGELTRNKNYVFALPARYNFAFPRGFEQVDEIVEGGSVRGLSR
jgi:hypothetical protein